MALNMTKMQRSFYLNGRKLADPGENMSIEEVRRHHSGKYPELNNASYEKETTETAVKITFTTAVGHKG